MQTNGKCLASGYIIGYPRGVTTECSLMPQITHGHREKCQRDLRREDSESAAELDSIADNIVKSLTQGLGAKTPDFSNIFQGSSRVARIESGQKLFRISGSDLTREV